MPFERQADKHILKGLQCSQVMKHSESIYFPKKADFFGATALYQQSGFKSEQSFLNLQYLIFPLFVITSLYSITQLLVLSFLPS